jgi:hypothetical protein
MAGGARRGAGRVVRVGFTRAFERAGRGSGLGRGNGQVDRHSLVDGHGSRVTITGREKERHHDRPGERAEAETEIIGPTGIGVD